jgi:uncharacterized protein YcbK (DUF882 family)
VGDLTEHFSAAEFACPHCGESQIDGRLVSALQTLRFQVGVPVRVTSGWRCTEHNRAVRGAPSSQHPLGTAADIAIAGMDVVEMYEAALLVPEFRAGGLGLYDSVVIHVDVRTSGRARWARIAGRYVSIGQALGIA